MEPESFKKLRDNRAIERNDVAHPYSIMGLVLVIIRMFDANLKEFSLSAIPCSDKF